MRQAWRMVSARSAEPHVDLAVKIHMDKNRAARMSSPFLVKACITLLM